MVGLVENEKEKLSQNGALLSPLIKIQRAKIPAPLLAGGPPGPHPIGCAVYPIFKLTFTVSALAV